MNLIVEYTENGDSYSDFLCDSVSKLYYNSVVNRTHETAIINRIIAEFHVRFPNEDIQVKSIDCDHLKYRIEVLNDEMYNTPELKSFLYVCEQLCFKYNINSVLFHKNSYSDDEQILNTPLDENLYIKTSTYNLYKTILEYTQKDIFNLDMIQFIDET